MPTLSLNHHRSSKPDVTSSHLLLLSHQLSKPKDSSLSVSSTSKIKSCNSLILEKIKNSKRLAFFYLKNDNKNETNNRSISEDCSPTSVLGRRHNHRHQQQQGWRSQTGHSPTLGRWRWRRGEPSLRRLRRRLEVEMCLLLVRVWRSCFSVGAAVFPFTSSGGSALPVRLWEKEFTQHHYDAHDDIT